MTLVPPLPSHKYRTPNVLTSPLPSRRYLTREFYPPHGPVISI